MATGPLWPELQPQLQLQQALPPQRRLQPPRLLQLLLSTMGMGTGMGYRTTSTTCDPLCMRDPQPPFSRHHCLRHVLSSPAVPL
jgi:hypothetical protein